MEYNEVVETLEAIQEVAASRRINSKYRTIGAAIEALLNDLREGGDFDDFVDEVELDEFAANDALGAGALGADGFSTAVEEDESGGKEE